MWFYLQPCIMPLLVVAMVIFIAYYMYRNRKSGQGNSCALGCALCCCGTVCLFLAAVFLGMLDSAFGTKTLYRDAGRHWYMETYEIDTTRFYSVGVTPAGDLCESGQPWYSVIGFQGGTAGWKQYPTELYLRQQSGALHYFNFKTATVTDLGNVPTDVPMIPVEEFFREL